MSQELFWCITSVNFIVVAILSIITIFTNIKNSKKVSKLNKKIGIDLTIHKEMMDAIFNFILSIGYDKINFSSTMENQEILMTCIKNHSSFKDSYLKLIFYIEYSFTSNEAIKKIIEKEYEIYEEIFKLLEQGIYIRIRCDSFPDKNSKNYDELYAKSVELLANYRSLLNQKMNDNYLINELKMFVREEALYIKNNRI